MKIVFDADISTADGLMVTYQIHDKINNRIVARGCTKAHQLPDDYEDNCMFCDYFDGEYCHIPDIPEKIIHMGGECPYKDMR